VNSKISCKSDFVGNDGVSQETSLNIENLSCIL